MLTLTITGNLYLPDGTELLPALAYSADTNTGFMRLGTDYHCMGARGIAAACVGDALGLGIPYFQILRDDGSNQGVAFLASSGASHRLLLYEDNTFTTLGRYGSREFRVFNTTGVNTLISFEGGDSRAYFASGIDVTFGNSATNATTGMDTAFSRQSAGIFRLSDSAGTGLLSTVRFMDPGTRPACDSTVRGLYWHEFGSAGVGDTIMACAKDNADAYDWRSMKGTSEFAMCMPGNSAAGVCHTFTNLGAAFTEVANNATRSNVNLSDFQEFRITALVSVVAVTGDVEIQCDTDAAFGSPTSLGTIANVTATGVAIGSWADIAGADCVATGGTYLRAGMSGGDTTEDPELRYIKLQVR